MEFPRLSSPGKINGLTLRNRVVMPPMGTAMNQRGGETPEKLIALFARRAQGGAAMLITEPIMSEPVTPELEGGSFINYHPRLNSRMYEWVESTQKYGARFCVALTPLPVRWMLRQMQTANKRMDEIEGEATRGVGIFNKLGTAEVEGYLDAFCRAGEDLKNLGVDAIEINFAFYFDYFTLSLFNKRTDKYAFGEENGLRYVREAIQGLRRAVGPKFPIMLMLDADQYTEGYRTIQDTLVMARKFEEWGVDCIRCRAGSSVAMEYDCIPQYLPKGCIAHLAAAVKQVVKIPVMANGKLSDPEVAEKLLAEGKADFISIARGLLADPDWCNKVSSGQADRVRKCISCNIACLGNLMMNPIRPLRCTVNPLVGLEEKHHALPKATVKKKVVVVGGGPGGMCAALTAAQRGHEVVLYEKAARLGDGGAYRLSAIPPFKQENLYIRDYYERELREYPNLKIVLGTMATARRVTADRPDAVIIATGARARRPGIPGADSPDVVTYEDVLLGKKKLGASAIVIGGGSVGCEVAHYLAEKGKKVTILEMLPRLAHTVNHATRNCLMKELTKLGVKMIAGASVDRISGQTVTYRRDNKQAKVSADTIILATGAESDAPLYKTLIGKVKIVELIGDAREPRQFVDAIREGYFEASVI
jgi:2,4-dienoyl-CoA reductase-like NADH-dependent reductase (Old Yellow Enzyme family)/thioredoxin reductase